MTDSALKRDPRELVEVVATEAAETGSELVVATVPAHAITLSLLPVAAADTEPRRNDRWRIKPALATALPARLWQLTSGQQSGSVRRVAGGRPRVAQSRSEATAGAPEL